MTLPSHTTAYRVRFDEAGPDGLLRTSGLLRYGQDVAWQHSEALGFDRGWYAERGLAWVVRAAEIEVLAPIPTGTQLAIRTEVTGWQRIWARRRAECRLPDGTLAAWVHSDWVMIDGRGRLVRVPPDIVERFSAPTLATLLRVPLPEPPAAAAVVTFAVRPHELDPMNHANNAVYVDWIEEALLADRGAATIPTARPRNYRLEYAAAAAPGMSVRVATWSVQGGQAVRLTGDGSEVLLRAVVIGARAEGGAG